jgi:hypothetical protein
MATGLALSIVSCSADDETVTGPTDEAADVEPYLVNVQNRWGGVTAPWHEGGTWVVWGGTNEKVVALDLGSADGGATLTGTVTYAGKDPIGLKATMTLVNNYTVEIQWGGPSAKWHPAGTWLIGCREGQNVVALGITSSDGGGTLTGTMNYAGEGPISFKSDVVDGQVYTVENRWGGITAPWHDGGVWVIGRRASQNVVAINVTSSDGGATLTGTMHYAGEGPIGFDGVLFSCNNYIVENSWGGTTGYAGGIWRIGCRSGQNVVAIDVESDNGGDTLTGTMSYAGEGPISFRATQSSLSQP